MNLHTALLSLLLITGFASVAAAHRPYRTERLLLPPGEARGCYYYRGYRYCGRYCYYEANGMRYCQQRAREAFPQAPVEPEPDEPPHGRRHHRTLK